MHSAIGLEAQSLLFLFVHLVLHLLCPPLLLLLSHLHSRPPLLSPLALSSSLVDFYDTVITICYGNTRRRNGR